MFEVKYCAPISPAPATLARPGAFIKLAARDAAPGAANAPAELPAVCLIKSIAEPTLLMSWKPVVPYSGVCALISSSRLAASSGVPAAPTNLAASGASPSVAAVFLNEEKNPACSFSGTGAADLCCFIISAIRLASSYAPVASAFLNAPTSWSIVGITKSHTC